MKQLMLIVMTVAVTARADELPRNFAAPPPAARPWVYWFPLNGNLTREGITADLEAMARVGIGGVLYMEVDQGAPRGPADFAGPLWRELLKHAGREAHRLGLEINMNNDAGWCGSGGPWITPELSMQKVVWTETAVDGLQKFAGGLARPQADRNFYRDISVLAMPTPAGSARIQDIEGKASFKPQHFPPQGATFPAAPADAVIARDRIVDLSAQMDKDGNLTWDVPAGQWLVMRFGHTTTGKDNHPAPESGRGLECDKFSKEAVETHYRGLMGKLVADFGPLAGKTLVSTHIDSWEVGSQNWTPRMREEFRQRRGYDLLPFLPAFAGYVVDSVEVSERFLWDLRQTVSELIVENYAGEFRRLAKKDGLRLSIEAYDAAPCDEMTYAGQADEPMAEFWKVGYNTEYSCTEMASAAHVYGKRILGAEAFTSNNQERWLEHPGSIKGLGDWAYCEGINRFVFHRYAAQPWTNVAPGMSMGPWGLHYERTQTWWEQSKAWHEYLARCQYLLQQGLFVADVVYLQPEGAPRRFTAPTRERTGYNFDGCTPEVLLTRVNVKSGRIVLPDGMSYRVLVLPRVETMTPALLRKIKELVEAGATVFAAAPPQKAPGLTDYPQCDGEVKKLAEEVWTSGKLEVWKNAGVETAQIEASNPSTTFPSSARWIWRNEGNPVAAVPPSTRHFRRLVVLEAADHIESARLVMTADNSFECSVNGQRVGAGDNFHQAYVMDVASVLKPGTNVLAVAATNGGDGPNPAALIGMLTIKLQDGRVIEVPTDRSWEAAEKPTGVWAAALELGPVGMAPWGEVEAQPQPAEIYPHAAAVGEWFARNGVPPDFSATPRLRYIHREIGDTDVYFVANPEPREIAATANFRITGKQPEFWWPDTGQISRAVAFAQTDVATSVPLQLEPNGSVFVVFRQPSAGVDPVVSVSRDGQPLLAALAPAKIVIQSARYGVLDDPKRTRDVKTKLQALVDAGELSFQVARLAEGDDPAYGTVKTLVVDYTANGLPLTITRRDAESIRLTAGVPFEVSPLDITRGETWQSGEYVFQTASGKTRRLAVMLPAPQEITGPWEVSFDPKWGGPEKVTFETLEDWSKRPEKEIKYYSGTATYRANFQSDIVNGKSKTVLDLGRVEVMAEVALNGKPLGILWKPPYRVDVTDSIQSGKNSLEIKVVNLWINRQIGDEQLPEDSDRNPNGTLKSWPAWLNEGQVSPTGRRAFTSWRLWNKDDPLVPSGLLGPVRLQAVEKIAVP
jgi:hypothetical protein